MRREAETLADAGYPIDLICYRKIHQLPEEELNGVRVYRIPMQRSRGSAFRYLWEYFYFTLRAFGKLTRLHLRNRYRLIHVHNMPDILIFSALVPRFTGAKILLDLHDPMPEVFMAKYGISSAHPAIGMLRFLERLSIRLADHVITPNLAFRKLFLNRGCPPQKVSVVMNTPMSKIFTPCEESKPTEAKTSGRDYFSIMFHGTVVKRHGLTLALQALERVLEKIPNIRFEVYGEGDFVQPFLREIRQRRLTQIVRYHGFVSNETIARVISEIDLGIIPNYRSPFTECNLPVRIFEYLSRGKPVIVPRLPGIQDYFPDHAIFYFEPDDADSLTQTILRVLLNNNGRQAVLENGLAIYRKYRWDLQKRHFISRIEQLICR